MAKLSETSENKSAITFLIEKVTFSSLFHQLYLCILKLIGEITYQLRNKNRTCHRNLLEPIFSANPI
jgi:hypothetical protein